jgi:hypothetical protein
MACATLTHADTDLDGKKTDLFSCDVSGRKLYGTHIDDIPGKCVALPKMTALLISIAEDGTRAGYLDLTSIKKIGATVELDLLLVKPDSSTAGNFNGSNVADFDMRTHKIYFCDSKTQTSNHIDLFKNFRTAPHFIKAFDKPNQVPQAITNPNSIDGRVLKYVCS